MVELAEMMVKAPFIMPEPPRPATARPTIKALDDWAEPHTADPTSKTRRKTRKVDCTASAMLVLSRG
jgi:hypothetical protein